MTTHSDPLDPMAPAGRVVFPYGHWILGWGTEADQNRPEGGHQRRENHPKALKVESNKIGEAKK